MDRLAAVEEVACGVERGGDVISARCCQYFGPGRPEAVRTSVGVGRSRGRKGELSATEAADCAPAGAATTSSTASSTTSRERSRGVTRIVISGGRKAGRRTNVWRTHSPREGRVACIVRDA
ncbi:MAG: hypothetical protein ACHQRK_07415 [Gemmatimonadales bacterium]